MPISDVDTGIKDRLFGPNTLLYVQDPAQAVPDHLTASFMLLGLLTDFQQPPDNRPTVPLVGMEDQAFVGGGGIPEESLFNFTHIWDSRPDDGVGPPIVPSNNIADNLLDDYWKGQNPVFFRLEETDGAVFIDTTFLGRVRNLVPTQVTATEGKRREVQVLFDGTYDFAGAGPRLIARRTS